VQVPSWHPQQHICHQNPNLACMIAWLTSYISSKGVTHIRRPVQKFQRVAEKIALFVHRARYIKIL
jgi:hypothetical protein